MKKLLYYPTFFLLNCISLHAQTQISFEASENYSLGNIHEQNGWEVTESGSAGIINNQIITSEKASSGTYSFKNGHQIDFDGAWYAIFGASKNFDIPIPSENYSISFDVFLTAANGSNFEFSLYGIENNEYINVAGIGFESSGNIYHFIDPYYGMDYIDNTTWQTNTWQNIKIELTSDQIKFYLNQNLIKTINNYSQADIYGFNMLHNNFGGDAYYDNIVINSPNLAINDREHKSLSIFPNPVKTTLNLSINTLDDIKNIEVMDLTGKKIIQSNAVSQIKTDTLIKGSYLLKVNYKDGKSLIRKFIKQ